MSKPFLLRIGIMDMGLGHKRYDLVKEDGSVFAEGLEPEEAEAVSLALFHYSKCDKTVEP